MSLDPAHQQIGQTVGAKLRAARLAKKYTQGQLARPDFSVSYISAIERGQIHPSLRALEIFAMRLGLTSTELLSKQTSQEENAFSAKNGSFQSGQEVELQFLEAHICVWQGAAPQAVGHLRNLNSQKLTPQQEIRRRYLLGCAYFNMARLQEAEAVLAEALKLAHDPHEYVSVQILFLLGMVHASMHNDPQALEYHQRCLDRLEKEQGFQDPLFLAQVYTNMGLHYFHLDKFDEAIQMFNRALQMTGVLSTPDQLRSMYLHASQHYVEAKDYFYAELYRHKSLQLHFQEYSNSLRSEIYYYLGRAVRQADQQRALDYLGKTLQATSIIRDQLALSSLSANMAELLLAQGNVDEAYEYARKAYDLASPSNITIITAYCLIVLGQIAYAQKNYEAGDAHFTAGLEMLERLDAREELADQYPRYAQLLEDRGMVQEALNYYKKAFEGRRKSE